MEFSEKQKQILKVAKQLFSTKGYAETSMRDLAEALDLKASSIYSHFSSKEAILLTICEKNFERMVEIKTEIESMEATPEEKFERYCFLHLQSVYHHPETYHLYYKYSMLLDDMVQRRFGMYNYEYFVFICNLTKGLLPNEVELDNFIPNSSALFVIDTLSTLPSFINPAHADLEALVKDLAYRIIYGYHHDMKSNWLWV